MLKLFDNDLSNYLNTYSADIIDALKENDTDPTPQNIDAYAVDQIENDASNIFHGLKFYDKITDYKNIYVVADLGLWYGRRKAFKTFNNLHDAVTFCFEDSNTLYFKSKKSTLTLCAAHHDGTNIFKFYKVINNKRRAITYNEIINAIY